MSKFLNKAGLPEDCCELVLGKKYSELLDNPLKAMGIKPIYLPNNPYVDERLSGHADLSVFCGGGREIFLAPFLKNTDFCTKITELGFKTHVLDIKQNKLYPFDATLNACIFGKNLIYSKEVTCADIVSSFEKAGEHKLISAKQGYARCSVCVVDDNSVITADRGIYKEAVKAGIDALLIAPGYVELSGFRYGFLGGASFKIASNKLCFTGSLELHPDKRKILSFLSEKNIEPVYLTDYPIFDIGSAIPITEK